MSVEGVGATELVRPNFVSVASPFTILRNPDFGKRRWDEPEGVGEIIAATDVVVAVTTGDDATASCGTEPDATRLGGERRVGEEGGVAMVDINC